MPVPYNPSGGSTYTLQSSISSTQTSITLTSFTVPVTGTAITMAVMNTQICYMTIAPRTSNAEFISFTGITQNADGTATLTGVTRGLDKNSPGTSVAGFKLPHAGSTQIIISDAPQVFFQYDVIANDVTITGRKQFPTGGTASAAVVGVTYAAPVQDNEIATKKYVDDIAIAGSPDATTTTKGIVELPTQAEQEAGTALGATGATLVLTNNMYGARNNIGYGTATGTVVGFTMQTTPTPTAYATGQIVGFTSSFTNTGNTTLNNCGLGAKDLWLGSTGLFPGMISTNSIVGAVYDGTRFTINFISTGDSQSATAYKMALRNSTGDVTVSTTPTASTDAASKAYVDSVTAKAVTGSYTVASSTTTTVYVGFRPASIVINATAGTTGAVISNGAWGTTLDNQYCTYTLFNTNGSVAGSNSTTLVAGVIQYGNTPAVTTVKVQNITSTTFDLVTVMGSTGATFYYIATP